MSQSVLMTSAVRNASSNSVDMIKSGEKGLHVTVNVTAVPGIDTVTPKIQGKDALGNYYDLVVGVPIVASGLVTLKVGLGILVAANLSVSDLVPDVWRVVMTHSAGTNFTYSVCAGAYS